jgi:hypothetical protein
MSFHFILFVETDNNYVMSKIKIKYDLEAIKRNDINPLKIEFLLSNI